MKLFCKYALSFLVLALSGCGGGGGGSTAPEQNGNGAANSAPVVNISGAAEIEANNTLLLTANASDADGSIASYAWVANDGLSLISPTTSQVSFIAPKLDKDTNFSLTVTVTDNKGATASATKQVTVKAKKTSLTINGLVLNNAPVKNADVAVSVGNGSFSTKSDASGKYTIDLSVNDDQLQNLVVVTASGDATNPKLKLASQLSSLSTLIHQAGTDGVLDATENIGVNISSLTTAEYALLTKISAYGTLPEIKNEIQFKTALHAVDGLKKIRLAALLQISATNSKYAISDIYQSTLDFIKDDGAVNDLLGLVDSELLESTELVVRKDKNLFKKSNPLLGTYLIYYDDPNSFYVATFNADGSGDLKSPTHKAAFQWSQQNNMFAVKFPVALETGRMSDKDRWVVKEAQMEIITESNSASFIQFRLSEVLVDSGDKEIYPNTMEIPATLFNTASAITPEVTKIQGDWFGGSKQILSYRFNADKSATANVPDSVVHTPLNYTWSIDSNKIILRGDNGLIETIYLTKNLGFGYDYIKINQANYKLSDISTGVLIQPQKNLMLTQEDIVGAWSDGASIRVMGNDGFMFTNFGGYEQRWNFIDSKNTWEKKSYTITGFGNWSSCDISVSVGTYKACELGSTQSYTTIARDEDTLYALEKETSSFSDNKTYLSISVKLPEIKYFSDWFLGDSEKTFFQKTSDGIKVWSFYAGNFLSIGDKSPYFPGHNPMIQRTFKNNNLHYVRNNLARELQLISVSGDGLTVCEFNEGSQCAPGNEFLLSNKSPVKISFKVEGNGAIFPANSSLAQSLRSPHLLFGNKAFFSVRADSGFSVKSVTGCGGTLDRDLYITAEVRDNCTITATFGK